MGLHKKHCNCFNERIENLQSQGFQNVHNKRCHLKWDLLGKWKFWMFMYIVRHKMIFFHFSPSLDLTGVWKIPCGKLRCKKICKTSTRLKDQKRMRKSWRTHPTVTSKMLLPTEEDTAMSPKPLRATITEVIRSGIEVPAARKVNPITCRQNIIWSWYLIFVEITESSTIIKK